MNEADIADLIRGGMLVMVKLAGPPLIVALVVGLAVALLQAITQINEATLAYVPKLIALGVALLLLGPFMFATLTSYTQVLFDRMAMAGGP
jgi:flagellar biosynthetic protein FliQ